MQSKVEFQKLMNHNCIYSFVKPLLVGNTQCQLVQSPLFIPLFFEFKVPAFIKQNYNNNQNNKTVNRQEDKKE